MPLGYDVKVAWVGLREFNRTVGKLPPTPPKRDRWATRKRRRRRRKK